MLEKSRVDQILNNQNKITKISLAIFLCTRQFFAISGHDLSIE